MSERLVFVYKSKNQRNHDLYIREKDVFSHIPSALLDAFGEPVFLMMFALSKHKNLPKVTPEQLEEALSTKGYFLRIDLDNKEENLLNVERKLKGLEPLTDEQMQKYFGE